MKKIGEGYTYNVFLYTQDRVIKIKKNPISRFFYIHRCEKTWKPHKIIERIIRHDREAMKFIKDLITRGSDFDFSTIGNPVFISSRKYEQDLCIPINKYMTEENFSALVDMYIAQIKYFWKYGFMEVVFNFTINNGIRNGEIVLFDFNEISTNKEEVAQRIQKKIWLERYSFLRELSESQKEIFKNKMEKEITIEGLDKYWNTSN